jgi:hypothetical protein
MVGVGGFFAALYLKADQASFDRSKKELGEIEKQTKKTGQEFDAFVGKAVKGLLTVGAAAIGAAGALAMMQAKQNVVATRANLGTTEFVNFGNAIKMLSGNADQFVQSMSGMQSAFDNIKLGDADEFQKMATSLALLGQATGKDLDINKLQGMTQAQRAQAIASSVESTNYKTESGRNALTLADRMLPGLGDALVAARNAGKTFAQAYADASSFRMVNNSTMSNSSKNAYELNKVGSVVGQIAESGLEKVLTALRPSIERISNYLIAHEKDFDKFFTQIGKLLDSIMPILGKIAEGVGGVIGGIIDGASYAGNRSDYLKSPKGQAEQKAIGQTFSKLPWGSVNVTEDQTKSWAARMAVEGTDVISKITHQDLVKDKVPTSVVISGNTIQLSEQQMKEVLAAKRSGGLPVFGDQMTSAAQLVILAHPGTN